MASPADALNRVVESVRASAGGPAGGAIVTTGETARALATLTPPPVSKPMAVVEKDTVPAGAWHVQTNVAAPPGARADGRDGAGPDTKAPAPVILGATLARSRLMTVEAPVLV